MEFQVENFSEMMLTYFEAWDLRLGSLLLKISQPVQAFEFKQQG